MFCATPVYWRVGRRNRRRASVGAAGLATTHCCCFVIARVSLRHLLTACVTPVPRHFYMARA